MPAASGSSTSSRFYLWYDGEGNYDSSLLDVPHTVKFTGFTSIKLQGNNSADNITYITDAKIGRHITSIPTGFLAGATNLSAVRLADSITEIPDGAFYGCTKLATINMPTDLTSIGQQAFAGCVNLQQFNINDSVQIAANAFEDVDSMAEYVPDPDAGKEIVTLTAYIPNESHYAEDYYGPQNGDREFDTNLDDLYVISVDSTVTYLPVGEFATPYDNIREIYIPNSVTAIGPYMFSRNIGLTKLVIDVDPSSISVVLATESYSGGEERHGAWWFYPCWNTEKQQYVSYNKNLVVELPRFTADDFIMFQKIFDVNFYFVPQVKLSDGRYYRITWEQAEDESWNQVLVSSDTPFVLLWNSNNWEWIEPTTEG